MAFAPPRRGSSFGSQYNARFRSAPQYSWGTAAVGAGSPQIYLSRELAAANSKGYASPGPVYHPPSQPSVRTPAFSFGGSSREPPHVFGSGRPGAPHVLLPGAFQAEQCETHKRTAPASSFGKSERKPLGLRTASPGDYVTRSRGDLIVDSRQHRAATFAFSSAQRFHDNHGTRVPGPGTRLPIRRRRLRAILKSIGEHGSAFVTQRAAPAPEHTHQETQVLLGRKCTTTQIDLRERFWCCRPGKHGAIHPPWRIYAVRPSRTRPSSVITMSHVGSSTRPTQ